MMPQLAIVRVRDKRGHRVRIWIPVLPVVLLLSPVLLLVLLALVGICLAYRVNPGRVLYAGWQLLCGLSGMRIDVDQADAKVLVSIR
jgi:hypothetical protein